MRKLFGPLKVWLCFMVLMLSVPRLQAAAAVSPRDRILILISLDAFRWDYLQKFKPPHLTRLASEGVHAERLIPSFPSLTFPNHYTLVTGLRPEHHGIIANSMYDPLFDTRFALANNPGPRDARWWGGEPVWVTAIKQGRLADCLFWPGSEASVQGVRPSEWRPFDLGTQPDACVDTALGWLGQPSEKRPSLVTLYFHAVDTAAHHHGVDSPDVAQAVRQVDDAIGRLLEGLRQLKLESVANLVVVSDHGMTDLSTNRVIALADLMDLAKVQVDFSGAIAGLRPFDGNTRTLYASIKAKESHFHVYQRENIPARFHFRDNRRIPPVVLVADEGWYISRQRINESSGGSLEKAAHGYDPRLASMGATFIAWGPAFRRGVILRPVENVHVYNLLCATLGLDPAPNDGDNRIVSKALAKAE